MNVDVAIIGGGPAGSTCGAFLCKYRPGLKVAIFEREKFPRDHVGESQLPMIGNILFELGAWDKIESAEFPIKIGATYRWGNTDDLWDFHFVPHGDFQPEPRPTPFGGIRTMTAFQVDRARYDQILLDHARELGCDVYEETAVRSVEKQADSVTKLVLDSGEEVKARYYIDATGHSGLIRRTMGVGIEEPSPLRNIAIWDYWQNAEWAVSIGVGGTRVQVMSLGYGWLWFIPLGPERTSIGLVCPAGYYKDSGLKPEELYLIAISEEPRIAALVANASREHQLGTTKDWSFVSERMTGDNWMLIGEATGFADPILAAGLTLAHASGREAAFTILEMDRGKGKKWLRGEYEARNRRRLLQHIRFADYWYSANAHFGDLKEFTREIAKDAGLELSADQAWRWLGTGGFIEEDMNVGGLATISFVGLHQLVRKLADQETSSAISGFNGFVLNLAGAEKVTVAQYELGQVLAIPGYRRNGKVLPLVGLFGGLVQAMQQSPRIEYIVNHLAKGLVAQGMEFDAGCHTQILESLEAMMRDGWIEGKHYNASMDLNTDIPTEGQFISVNRDDELPPDQVASSLRK